MKQNGLPFAGAFLVDIAQLHDFAGIELDLVMQCEIEGRHSGKKCPLLTEQERLKRWQRLIELGQQTSPMRFRSV